MRRRALSSAISVVAIQQIGDEVAKPHTKQARLALTDDGGQWIAKSERTIRRHGLRAEVVGHLVSVTLGMPTPAAAVAVVDGVYWWCSQLVPASAPYASSSASRLARPALVARLLMLDLLIFNEDRHRDNMLLVARLDDRLDLLAIDHESAWIGSGPIFPENRTLSLEKCPDTLYEHPKLHRWVRAEARAIAKVPPERWHAIASLSAQLVPETSERTLGQTLAERAANLGALAEQALRAYRSVL